MGEKVDSGSFPLEHELALDDSVLTNRMHPLLRFWDPHHGRRCSLLLACFLWKHIPWEFWATRKSSFPDATEVQRPHGDGKKKQSKNPRCSCPLVFQSLAFFLALPSIVCQTWSQEIPTPANAERSGVKSTVLSLCPNCRFLSTNVAIVLEATKSWNGLLYSHSWLEHSNTSQLLKEHCFLLMGNGIRNKIWVLALAHCSWALLIPNLFSTQGGENVFQMHMFVCIFLIKFTIKGIFHYFYFITTSFLPWKSYFVITLMYLIDLLHPTVPGGANGKEPACQCRRYERCWFDPWVRKIPWRRPW